MATPTHLDPEDYDINFPASADEFPTVVDLEHYIDAWLLNHAYNALDGIEDYLIAHKTAIELAPGSDINGDNGDLEIPIPAGAYIAGKKCTASDTNLVAGNIKSGVNIFGVAGSLEGGGGAGACEVVAIASVISETPVSETNTRSLPAAPSLNVIASAA